MERAAGSTQSGRRANGWDTEVQNTRSAAACSTRPEQKARPGQPRAGPLGDCSGRPGADETGTGGSTGTASRVLSGGCPRAERRTSRCH